MWECKAFSELNTQELHAIYKLRVAVFVVEQNCAYQEVDDEDLGAFHLFKWEKDDLVAYARLIPGVHAVHLGRVIVAREWRQKGYGKELLTQAIAACTNLFLGQELHAQAQAHLEEFYHSFGFEPTSGIYLEDGIPHLDMIREQVGSLLSRQEDKTK